MSTTPAQDRRPEPSGAVAVIGLGTMGSGIAEVFAAAGHEVIGVDADDAALDRGRQILDSSTARAVARDKLSADEREALLGRISYRTEMAAVADAAVIVEAVSEDLELKSSIFARLGELAAPDALLATNTSSLSITAIAAASGRPERVVGMHFFNPAPVQALVEVVRTVGTDPDTETRALELVSGLGKTPIGCGDRAGFVVNALLVPYLNRAALLYQDGFATAEEIDETMVSAAGHPMGPLELLDLVGLDVTVSALNRMYDETRDRRHTPAPILSTLVTAGHLGRKTGTGIRVGADPARLVPHPPVSATTPDSSGLIFRQSRVSELPNALLLPYLNDACRMVEIGYATPDTIDTGMSLGCRMPKPFDVLGQLGTDSVLAGQQQIFGETAEPGHRPSPLLEQLAHHPDPAAALTDLRSMAR